MSSEAITAAPALSAAEQVAEALECARYGELEELQALCGAADAQARAAGDAPSSSPGLAVAARNADGSSCLHMAASNGHGEVVAWLLEKGADPAVKNASGSNALHWALLNAQKECVRLMIKHDLSGGGLRLDVLENNGFGQTAVAQAFEAQDAELLTILLEHPTSARLNKDGSVAPVGQQSDLQKEEQANAGKKQEDEQDQDQDQGGPPLQQTMVSFVKLTADSAPFPIQEVGFVKDALKVQADDADLETTGAFLWASSLVLARWVANAPPAALAGKRVVELGAGCALPGIAAALCAQPRSVAVTDLRCETFANTEGNVARNAAAVGGPDVLVAHALDWCDHAAWPDALKGQADVIIGSDLVYEHRLVQPLVDSISLLLTPSGPAHFYYVSADSNRAGRQEFLQALQDKGFAQEILPVPQHYLENPFVQHDAPDAKPTDDQLFALRFPEIAASTLTMYRFTRQ